MNSTKIKVGFVRLYALIIGIGYSLLGLFAPNFLLLIDPTSATATYSVVGLFGSDSMVGWVLLIFLGVFLYRFSIWGKYGATILILFSWLPLSSAIKIAPDLLWLLVDGTLLYLIWFDKSTSKMFKI